MSMRFIYVAVIGAVLAPSALVAQMDPNPSPASQQNMSQPDSSGPTTMRESLGAPGLTGQQMADRQFLRTATEIGIADVKLGQLAVLKGTPEVKTLAQQLVDDHVAINKDMGGVADSLGVMLPKKMNKDDQAEYDKLNGLSGKDFDTEYLTYISKAHWATLHTFYLESSSASDPALQAEVVKSLLAMHQHVGLIAKAATADGVTLPPRPARPAATTASK